MRSSALAFVAAFALSTTALVQPASATTLTGTMTVDNSFTAYLSTNDLVLGTVIGSGTNWQAPQSVNGTLSSGTNYLHIIATDSGGPRMFIGEFHLSDAGFSFSNGTQDLLSNTTNWVVSNTGFGVGYVTPTDEGADGTAPNWGNTPGVNDSAHFIWGNLATSVVYFSTTITDNGVVTPPSGVPEPGTLMLLG